MSQKPKKWIFGAGAQGRVTLEVWRSAVPDGDFSFIDDDPSLHGKVVNGAPIVGGLEFILDHFGPRDEVIVAMGNNKERLLLGDKLEADGLKFGNAIHNSTVIMESGEIGGGCMLLAHTVVNTGAKLGKHVIVNTGAIVEHDSIIKDGVQLGPGVSMGGRVVVEKSAFIGTGAVLAPRIRVGEGTVVGAGSVVVKDLPPSVLAYGVPARLIREIDDDFDWSRLL
ncbi:MAG: acetyltransferase [Syntrophobacterales bacterium]|jgi:sugar O-acyltransferase (sialic acid O-acetyltransferase NeuD family)